ncbi:prephenate dehydratase [Sulfurihydrogenibium azorense]|jgi:chorismate mutase/prephenate dehydratase|uniref:Bifunctional chorismate mutase/prephenate dehydratase n=1 Tax=Sulfurihydrogenibium azorense (strain DSM 15241 / OCM 825 / Az-Fu1) TaxID=204536 RepID=C1DTN5_SULAA|nr:prephenate dehydratase [Sulfurihydrogenibium azorense]ACN99611.1 chorismate mutase/prephenate dehydratase [Sulfurihydrogenibium azorense Az-Fu1]
MEYQEELKNLRKEIDDIDQTILQLLNKRALLAKQVGEIKKKNNLPIFVPSREKEIFERLEKLNTGPLSNDVIKHIFREIISACRSVEENIKVAYLGPKATFTHQASLKYFGSAVDHIPVSTIKDVFEEIAKKKVNYGVVPVENTIEGVVNYTLDMFLDYDLKIIGEVILEISLHLMSINPNINEIQRIYSHKFAIAECRDWLQKNMPNAQIIEVESTAKAAEMARDDYEAAAIASESAAIVYGLHILERKIDKHLYNYTRFLIIGNEIPQPTGKDKTTFIFSVKNEVGALYKALEPFYKNQINMTKIESRPSKKEAWDYIFFTDIEGHIHEEKVSKTLEELKSSVPFFKILGSYPKAQDV